MWRAGPISKKKIGARMGVLAATVAGALGLVPASASASTIANGNYTADPGESNRLSIGYDAATDSYIYREGGFRITGGSPSPIGITDGDGLGGCTLTSPRQATCPAALVTHINISLLDGDDYAFLCGCFATVAPAYNVGSIVAVGATIELGEGDDQALGGSGDDFISGGPGNDGVAGGPGNDTVLGGEGSFDAVDFPGSVGMPTFGLQAYDPTAGTDRVDGGPGHDQVGGLEGTISGPTPFGGCCAIVGLEPSLVRPDVITCGDPTDDVAFYGPSDQVNIDCEQLIQVVPCPKGGCDGVVTIYATVPSPGGSTATASGRKKRRVTVGKARLKGSGGFLPAVQIRLSEKRLSRVLGGRQRAPGETVTRLKAGKKGKKSGATTAAGKKFRIAGRTRFVFTKG